MPRQKAYNYTEKHDKIAKNVALAKSGELHIESQEDLLRKSGYKNPDHYHNTPAAKMIVEEIYSTKDRVKRIKDLGQDREDDVNQKRLELDTLKELNKMGSVYAEETPSNLTQNNYNIILNNEQEQDLRSAFDEL